MHIFCGRDTLPIIAVYLHAVLGRPPTNGEVALLVSVGLNSFTLLCPHVPDNLPDRYVDVAHMVSQHIFQIYTQARFNNLPEGLVDVHVANLAVYITQHGVLPDVAYYSSSQFTPPQTHRNKYASRAVGKSWL